MDAILNFLSNPTVISVIIGALVIAFAKSITRIFRMGATFKGDLATRQELRDFEAEMKGDMRAYATQIQRAVLDATMRVIDTKLKNVDDMSTTATEMKVLKAEIETEIKNATSKFTNMAQLEDSVRVLKTKVDRLEYGDRENGGNPVRRTEK